jgi:hypothetical protein
MRLSFFEDVLYVCVFYLTNRAPACRVSCAGGNGTEQVAV